MSNLAKLDTKYFYKKGVSKLMNVRKMSYLKETTQPCSREVSKVKRVQTDGQTDRRTDWRQTIGVQKGSTEPWVEFCLQVILIYFFAVGCRKNDLFMTSSIVLISVKSKRGTRKLETTCSG